VSVVVIRSINCDGCATWIGEELGRASEVRALARRHGWRTDLPGGKDYCPACWDRMKNTTLPAVAAPGETEDTGPDRFCDGRGCVWDGERSWCDGGCPPPPTATPPAVAAPGETGGAS